MTPPTISQLRTVGDMEPNGTSGTPEIGQEFRERRVKRPARRLLSRRLEMRSGPEEPPDQGGVR